MRQFGCAPILAQCNKFVKYRSLMFFEEVFRAIMAKFAQKKKMP